MRRWLLLAPALLSACDKAKPPPADSRTPESGVITAPIVNDVAPEHVADQAQPGALPKPARTTPASPPAPRASYRAIGTEPFWAITLRGAQATLERPDHPPMRYRVTRADDDQAIRYGGDGFAMTLTPGPCSDGMSDAIWSDRVQVAFAGGTLKGCGGRKSEPDGEDREPDRR